MGILIPRIDKVNRPVSPATGLLIYQIDDTAGFYYFDGSAWQRLNNTTSSTMQSQTLAGFRTLPALKSGKSELKNGTTFIKFDRIIENPEELNINLTLEGDCNGVFISKKTSEGFEVRELQKGKSDIKFSWSIIR